MTFPDSTHLRHLQQDLWLWPKSRASVMVGAGFSLNAEPLPGISTRFPTWPQLTRSMFDELHPVLPGDSSEQTAREAHFSNANALRIASEYEAAFGKHKLHLLIRSQIPDSDHQPGKLHRLLLQLPWADVFTTNYDTLLERTEVDGRTYQPVIKASELTTAFAPRIVKLHGSFPSQTPFIISEEDYRTYPRAFAPFVNSVQQSLLENSIVLLGFSGNDPNFLAWTGWIRDELVGNHSPFYLVGPLMLNDGGRSLLMHRGVTPIDLGPLFSGVHTTKGIHEASIEWFLMNLASARKPRPEKWPNFVRVSVAIPKNSPPILDFGDVIPDPIGLAHDHRTPLTSQNVADILARWRFERVKYPGWVVAPEGKRSTLWQNTKYWTGLLVHTTKDWAAADRILLFREINWRFETAFVPLFPEIIEPFERAFNDVFGEAVAGRPLSPLVENLAHCSDPNFEVIDAWFSIAFGLLREARETYNSARWEALKTKIRQLVEENPKYADRICYEEALWATWNVERESLKAIMAQWIPSPGSPLAAIWKAGLLAESDALGESRTILRTALLEIRRSLRNQGRNIELLSLEGWCTYLLYMVETALNFERHPIVREEFGDRWDELKAWDCNPWPHKDYFEQILSAPPPRMQKLEEEVQSFDPGEASISRRWPTDPIGSHLPAFACIRLYEQVGLPMRLPYLDIAGDALKNACRWIAPFIGFWSPALLIRAGKVSAIKNDDFLC